MIKPDEFSPSETLISFPTPIPLLRHPTPNHHSPLLAFPNPNSFSSAYTSCETSILTQCESAARIGCSVAASDTCKPPWWRTLLSRPSVSTEEMKERERCEERQMTRCFEGARVNCRELAASKCATAFRDARVVAYGRESVLEIISCVCFGRIRPPRGFRIVRGSDLLGKQL